MEVTSKFSKLYMIQLYIGYFGGLAIIITLLFFSKLNISNPLFWLTFPLIAFYTYAILDLTAKKSLITKLTVSEKGIEIEYLNSKEKDFIKFNQISNVKVKNQRLRISRNPINDGYFETSLLLDDKSVIIISENQFDNYNDIMKIIHLNLKKLHVA